MKIKYFAEFVQHCVLLFTKFYCYFYLPVNGYLWWQTIFVAFMSPSIRLLEYYLEHREHFRRSLCFRASEERLMGTSLFVASINGKDRAVISECPYELFLPPSICDHINYSCCYLSVAIWTIWYHIHRMWRKERLWNYYVLCRGHRSNVVILKNSQWNLRYYLLI
jgi:hypothetical protein